MIEPSDRLGSGISQGSVQEGAWGWFRVGCVTLILVVVPMWVLLTASVIQLSPELSMMVVDGVLQPRPLTLAVWFKAGGMVAFYMLIAVPFLLAAITLGRAVTETIRLRADEERAAMNAELRDEAVIEDPDWTVAEDEPESPDAIHSAPS